MNNISQTIAYEGNYRDESLGNLLFNEHIIKNVHNIFSSSYEGNIPCSIEEFVNQIGSINRFIHLRSYAGGGGNFYISYKDGSLYSFIEISDYKKHINGHFTAKMYINGDQHYIDAFDQLLKTYICPPSITWVVDQKGNTVNFPVNVKPTFDSMYPFITRGVESYITAFTKSSSNILILFGEPGTGKTSFLKQILLQTKSNAYVTYDPKVMGSDFFFSDFLGNPNTNFLIFEDADLFLTSRKDGNDIMHMFLNVGDGLLSAPGKKIIFTTNLPSVAKIDPALVRKGRCFDVLKFRKLTKPEAEQVQKDCGLSDPLEDKKEFTLTEIFNGGNNSEVVTESNYGRIS